MSVRHSFPRAFATWFFIGLASCRASAPSVVAIAPSPKPVPTSTFVPATVTRINRLDRWECTHRSLTDGPEKDDVRMFIKANNLFATAEQTPKLDSGGAREFILAQSFLKNEQWAEATKFFGDVAFSYPQSPLGPLSALLYFDGIGVIANVLVFKSLPTDCFDEMQSQLPKLQTLYCEKGQLQRNPALCYEFYKMEREFAPKGSCNPMPSTESPEVIYAKVGALYLAWANRCVELTKLAGVSPLKEHCDDDAFNAARAFFNVPDLERAAQARALLLDPNNGMTQSTHIEELEKLWR